MAILTPKELIKLAAACRKAGIEHYKQGDVEFTLTKEDPKPKRSSKKNTEFYSDSDEFESDALTQDALLFWSSNDDVSQNSDEAQ